MKVLFYRRNDGTSLDYVGRRVMENLSRKYEVKEQIIGQELTAENIDIGVVYGLVRDLAYLKRHKRRFAGLVCEADLNDRETEIIRRAELEEIWIPSKFCEEKFLKAGFKNLRIVPHGVDEVPVGKCTEDNVLMIYSSYPGLSWTTLRKRPFESIDAVRRNGRKLLLRTNKERYYRRYEFPDIEFVGYQDNMDKLFDRCSSVLCPSDSEGFGLVGLEALARGIPLISTHTGNDYLEGMHYIHIDLPVTSEKIYDALEKLYNNWYYHNEKATEQRERVLEKYRWNNVLSNLHIKE